MEDESTFTRGSDRTGSGRVQLGHLTVQSGQVTQLAAAIVPLRDPGALARLEREIRETGFIAPLVRDSSDGTLIDGRARQVVAERLGIACSEVVHTCDSVHERDLLALRLNFGSTRTSAERREAARAAHAAHPDWSCRQIARTLGMSPTTVSKVIITDRAAAPALAQSESHGAAVDSSSASSTTTALQGLHRIGVQTRGIVAKVGMRALLSAFVVVVLLTIWWCLVVR